MMWGDEKSQWFGGKAETGQGALVALVQGSEVRYKEMVRSLTEITNHPIVVQSLPREKTFSQVQVHSSSTLNPPLLTVNMLRAVALALFVAFLAGANAEDVKSPAVADEATRGGGYSQQYHYNSYPQHGGQGGGHDPYGYTYAGLSFDLSTGLFLALGAIIVLLALAAVIYPLLSKNSGYGGDSYSSSGYGSGGGASSYGSYRSYNIAGTAEKVLSAIEKVYDAYNKSQ